MICFTTILIQKIGKLYNKDYGVVSIVPNSPTVGRTTIVLSDYDILDPDNYECVANQQGERCSAINLNIAIDFNSEANVSYGLGSFHDQTSFDISSTTGVGTDMSIFNTKLLSPNTRFQYIIP